MLPSRAELLAREIHADDVDKAGEPYVGHLARVAAMVEPFGSDYLVVAWLHDALEDHLDDMSADHWNALQDAAHRKALVALTRQYASSEQEYFSRILDDQVATVVKAADLLDNTAPSRLARLDPATQVRLAYKYIGPVGLLARCDLPGDLRPHLKVRVRQLARVIVDLGPPVRQERDLGEPSPA